jgi:hypothetical protein
MNDRKAFERSPQLSSLVTDNFRMPLCAIDIPNHSFSGVDERVAERNQNKLNLPEMSGAC